VTINQRAFHNVERAKDRSWHEAAVRRVQNYVRFLGYSGREMLAVRLSHFDPIRTFNARRSKPLAIRR